MSSDNPIYIFPTATNGTYLAVLVTAAIMFGIAIYMVRYQRRAQERARLKAEWDGIETILSENEMGVPERDALRALLRRRAPEHPYRAITQRHEFDNLLRHEMEHLAEGKSPEQYNEVGEMWRSIRCALGLDFIPVGFSIGSTRDLYRDQKVWVAPVSGSEPAHWHGGRIVHINEAHFFVALDDAASIKVSDGGTVHCRLWREDDARYSFDTRLIRKENRPAGWMLAHTQILERTQDRSHFRITHDQSVDIQIIEAPRDGNFAAAMDKAEIAVVHGRVTSLSGGGFAVSIPQPLPPQVLLRFVLKLDSVGGSVLVVGRVVGNQPLFAGRYLIRCAFVELPEEDRDLITQFVFRRQTQQRAAAEA